MPLNNFEINLILTWSEDCVISSAIGKLKFKITDAKLYFPVVNLSTQDKVKLLEQLKSGFERPINWNNYQPKVSAERKIQYLDFLINPSFQGADRLFVFSFENEDYRKVSRGYYLPKVEIKDYNVIIDRKFFFDKPIKSDIRTYDNIHRIATSQGHDYTTGCLLDYNYFNKHYKMIAIDLSRKQVLDGNLDQEEGATMFFIIQEAKETILDFLQGTVKVL